MYKILLKIIIKDNIKNKELIKISKLMNFNFLKILACLYDIKYSIKI